MTLRHCDERQEDDVSREIYTTTQKICQFSENNCMKHWLILIVFIMQRLEEIWR